MMPGAVIGALANERIESAPGARGDRFAPSVEVRQNPANAPKRTGVLDRQEEGQGFFDALSGLGLTRPAWILGQTRAARASRGVKVRDHHVVEQDVVQAARAEATTNQVRMDVQYRDLAQCFFNEFGCRVHESKNFRTADIDGIPDGPAGQLAFSAAAAEASSRRS